MGQPTAGVGFLMHGVSVGVETDSVALREGLRRDFSYFAADHPAASPHVRIQANLSEPPWQAAAEVRRGMVHSDFVAYDDGDTRWVDYHGTALSRWDFEREEGQIWSDDPAMLHELTYLLLLSRVGEIHDRRGIHRAHALGIALGGQGVLCFLPSGGGKTTLGLSSLRMPGVKLLSEDTPLITRQGELLAFPTRIGCTHPPPEIPAEFVRPFERRHYGQKWLIDVEAFRGRIAERADPAVVLLGERTLKEVPEIVPVARRTIAAELFRSIVVGYGLPQVVEYFLRWDPADMARKAALVASRAEACRRLLTKSRHYRFVLSRDKARNAALFHQFLNETRDVGRA